MRRAAHIIALYIASAAAIGIIVGVAQFLTA